MADQGGSHTTLALMPHHQQQQQKQSVVEHINYKGRLLEFAQRSNIPAPMYRTVNNVGPLRALEFKSTVVIDGETYSNLNTFSTIKAAEQDVSRIALEGLCRKIKDCISKKTTEGEFPPIHKDRVFCKLILNEFAAKMNVEKPKYYTDWLNGSVPIYRSSIVFNGVKYMGEPAISKKEAEQLAARAAILSILADSRVGLHLSEIVKSKAKLLSAVHELSHPNSDPDASPLQPNSATGVSISAIEGESEGTSQSASRIENIVALALPQQSRNMGCFENEAGNAIEREYVILALPQQSGKMGGSEEQADEVIGRQPPRHECRKPALGTSSQAIPLPNLSMPSLEDKILVSAPSLENKTLLSASSLHGGKRKSKRGKKGKKKAKTEIEKQVSQLPLCLGMPVL